MNSKYDDKYVVMSLANEYDDNFILQSALQHKIPADWDRARERTESLHRHLVNNHWKDENKGEVGHTHVETEVEREKEFNILWAEEEALLKEYKQLVYNPYRTAKIPQPTEEEDYDCREYWSNARKRALERHLYGEDWKSFSKKYVSRLRDELLKRNEEFEELWAEEQTKIKTLGLKYHPFRLL